MQISVSDRFSMHDRDYECIYISQSIRSTSLKKDFIHKCWIHIIYCFEHSVIGNCIFFFCIVTGVSFSNKVAKLEL